jgi:membrane protease YdiL (CAAX protease family)
MFDREKIFNSRRVTPPAHSGFRAVTQPRAPRHHWPLPAILSILFALGGLRYTIHNWHHPDDPSPWATPLVAIAILLAAWNRFRRRPDSH